MRRLSAALIAASATFVFSQVASAAGRDPYHVNFRGQTVRGALAWKFDGLRP